MSKTFLITFFFLAFISQKASAQSPGEEAQTFNYVAPTKWGDQGVGFKLCATGNEQSPVNIDTKTAIINKELHALKVVYKITNATLMTNGLGAQLSVEGNSEVMIGDRVYKLLNLRWHTPSEHTIDGKTFVAELHQLFVAGAGEPNALHEIAIIATVYLIGAPDPIVAAVEPEMTKLAKEMGAGDEPKELFEPVPVEKLGGDLLNKIPTETYIAYPGSLTVPPCSEGVTWFLTNPQTITLEQAKLINGLQSKSNKANSRPIQPTNGRLIQTNAK